MYSNIASYKFIHLEESKLDNLCKSLKQKGLSNALKGTILLGTEGINLFLAGEEANIKHFQDELAAFSVFSDLTYKYSYSDFIPFTKLIVKVRKEIVTFKQEDIHPEQVTAPYIDPLDLKQWLTEKKDFILLDTRNTFEYEIGTFEEAIHLNIDHFREFSTALEQKKLKKDKPIVTFCTGGIRCEKAAAYLLKEGYEQVYQLQGGILNYFEQCGGDFYQGDCFVFDDRIKLNSKLEPVQVF